MRALTRRQALAAGAAALAWPAAARARARAPSAWPMPAHDVRGRRWVREPVAAGVRERWRLRLEGGVPGAAAVVGGVVYAASFGGEVVAADLTTGRVRWRVRVPTHAYGDPLLPAPLRETGAFAGPAVARGLVLVATDRLTALDARTGRVAWQADPPRTATSDDYFWGAPTVAGGVVLVGSGSGSERATARGALTAHRLSDGALLWRTRTVPDGANGGGVIAPATVDRRRVFVATGAPYAAVPGENPGTCSLIELDLRDGSVEWSDQVHPGDARGLDLTTAPVLLGGAVFVGGKDGVRAWNRRTRRRLWHRQLTPESLPGQGAGPYDGMEFGPLACDGRTLYALSNDAARASHVAAALDPATGAVRWQTRLPGFAFAAPALAGGELWTGSVAGVVSGLRTSDGRVVRRVVVGEPCAGAVSAAAGRVLVGTGTRPYLPGESLVCLG
jgi:outer membrane protein assembly factor BamB